MTTEERHVHWQTIIDNQAASGMKVTAYCQESHISSSLFYTWRRKLREQQPFPGGFVELKTGRRGGATSGLCIRVGAKLSIEVEKGFDPYTLRAVIETLCSDRCLA